MSHLNTCPKFRVHFIALRTLNRTKEALASFQRNIAINPDSAESHAHCGDLFQECKQTAEALASYDRAIALNPNFAETHFNRGVVLQELKRTEEALASYERAIAINPEFAEPIWNKSLALLSLGNFEQGWHFYEWRWKRANQADLGAHYKIAQPLWLGEHALTGKTILLHAEQGLGDTIQFCRYAKLVKALGATVVLELPKALTGLLSGLEGVDRVIEQGSPLPGFDYHCPLMSLPLAFKTRLDTIPSSERYLSADPAKSAHWKQKLGSRGRLRIGLVWSGGFRPEQPELWAENQRRNLPFELLGILNSLDVDFISLQKGEPAESEFAAATRAGWASPAIADYSAEIQDFTDTAALIESLDLVISVDTSVAHLAAALGRPVWILNRFDNCWRWLQNREDSPWYPTVKLYKQVRAGDWGEVIRRVRQDLISLVI